MSIPDKAVEAYVDAYMTEVLSRVDTAGTPSHAAVLAGLEAAEPYLTGGGWFDPESLQDRLAVAEEKVRLLTEELRIARSEVKS